MQNFKTKSCLFICPDLQARQVKRSQKGGTYSQTKSVGTVFLTAPNKISTAITKEKLNEAKVGITVVTTTGDEDAICNFQDSTKKVGVVCDAHKFKMVTEKRFKIFDKHVLRQNEYFKTLRRKTHVNGKLYNEEKIPFFKLKGTTLPKSISKLITKKTATALKSISKPFVKKVNFFETLTNFLF